MLAASDKTSIAMSLPVYSLPIGQFRWNKISDVLEAIKLTNKTFGTSYTPTAESLIDDFANLAPRNRNSQNLEEYHARTAKLQLGPCVFRYSVEESVFFAVRVNLHFPADKTAKQYRPFILPIPQPYYQSLYVQDAWAISTLNAIQQGFVCVEVEQDLLIGYRHGSNGQTQPFALTQHPETFEIKVHDPMPLAARREPR